MFTGLPQLTAVGKTIILRAMGGEEFTLTKFQAGSGFLDPGETPANMTALKSLEVDDIAITQAEGTEDDGFIQVTGSFDNQTNVQSDFLWTELGLIAEDGDGNEYLYAYAYDPTYAEYIRAGGSEVVVEQSISFIVAIGDSENITAYVLPNATYATKQEFDAHVDDHTNPHAVTYTQVGAAAASHTHGAVDIASGILPVARGGTGYATLAALAAALRSDLGLNYVMGTFLGDGTLRRNFSLGFTPSAVVIQRLVHGGRYDTDSGIIAYCYQVYIAPGVNFYSREIGDSYASCDADTLFNRGRGGAAIMTGGFAVGHNGNEGSLNASRTYYQYIAHR